MNLLVIDTETTNGLEQPIPYDIGYAIFNEETGETYLERSFVVAEVFLDKPLMKESFYAEKIPQYWEEIKSGQRKMAKATTIKKIISDDMKKFNVKKVGAYNMNFDKRSTNNGMRYITKSAFRWFFPYKTELFCIWNMACSSILKSEDYKNWVIKNNFVSESGNLKTSAEVVYKYLKNDADFTESHTGLEDVKIEIEILKAVLESKQPYDSSVCGFCWRKIQRG